MTRICAIICAQTLPEYMCRGVRVLVHVAADIHGKNRSQGTAGPRARSGTSERRLCRAGHAASKKRSQRFGVRSWNAIASACTTTSSNWASTRCWPPGDLPHTADIEAGAPRCVRLSRRRRWARWPRHGCPSTASEATLPPWHAVRRINFRRWQRDIVLRATTACVLDQLGGRAIPHTHCRKRFALSGAIEGAATGSRSLNEIVQSGMTRCGRSLWSSTMSLARPVVPAMTLAVPLVDLMDVPPAGARQALQRRLTQEAQYRFDITRAPLGARAPVPAGGRPACPAVEHAQHHLGCWSWACCYQELGVLTRRMGRGGRRRCRSRHSICGLRGVAAVTGSRGAELNTTAWLLEHKLAGAHRCSCPSIAASASADV